MYVDFDKGFGVVAFHFEPEYLKELRADKKLSDTEIMAALLAKSTIVASDLIPGGPVLGAANVFNVLHRISVCIVESFRDASNLLKLTSLEKQNDRDDRVASINNFFKINGRHATSVHRIVIFGVYMSTELYGVDFFRDNKGNGVGGELFPGNDIVNLLFHYAEQETDLLIQKCLKLAYADKVVSQPNPEKYEFRITVPKYST